MKGEKMKKDKAIFIVEGDIQENMQHELSKKIDSVCKEFGLDSYLDDVIDDEHKNTLSDKCYNANCDGDECPHNDEDDNICEHNNTITNECSDCNEQELKEKK